MNGLLEKVLATIEDVDFAFENSFIKAVAIKGYPEVKLAGLKAESLVERGECEVRRWAIEELERAGVIRPLEMEQFDLTKLSKMHWKEGVQPPKLMVPLPWDFYPRLRRYIGSLRRSAMNNPEKMKEYERALQLSKDLVNIRLRKIISLASASAQVDRLLQSLTKEEQELYKALRFAIDEWKRKILE